jgi:hypothetical protein
MILNAEAIKVWREECANDRYNRSMIFADEWRQLCDLALKGLSSGPNDAEATDPETPGTWEERCAALYQVIGCLAHTAGIFAASDDVGDALDVAAGRGNVFDLLPWPKDNELFRKLEEHCKPFEAVLSATNYSSEEKP